MSGSFFRIKLAGCVLAALALCAGALAGNREKHLAAAGPKPLRFRQELPEFNPAWLLPALDMGDAPAASTNAPAEPVKPAEQPANTSAESPKEESVAPNESNVTVTVTAPPKDPQEPMEPLQTELNSEQNQAAPATIAPQALLRYFSRNGTNEVLVPYNVEFTPPVPARGEGSSAIYISE